tara:strand:- start:186 stop:353 length:168 start_codon:yes stop_codon:yes gene_type:complete
MARPRIHPERTVVKTSFAVHTQDLEFLDALREEGQSRSEVLRQIIDRTRQGQPEA